MDKLKVNVYYRDKLHHGTLACVFRNYFNSLVQLNFLAVKNEEPREEADLHIYYGFLPVKAEDSSLFIPARKLDYRESTRIKLFPDSEKSLAIPLYREAGNGNEFLAKAGTGNKPLRLNHDLPQNIFYHLASKAEYLSETRQQISFDDSQNQPAPPLVERYYLVLDRLFQALGIGDIDDFTWRGRLKKEDRFFVCLTHDVDTFEKDWAVRIKKGGFLLSGLFRLKKWRLVRERLDFIRRLFFSGSDYNCFEKIVNLEKKYGFHSSFYFYYRAKADTWKQFAKQRLVEPVYDLEKEERLQELLAFLSGEKMEIGLHPGTGTARSPVIFRREKTGLENLAGGKIIGSRQHWLEFFWDQTPRILAQVGCHYDATVYFKEKPGWRAGASFPYLLFDHNNQRLLPVWEFPTVYMDMTRLFGRDSFSPEALAENTISWLELVKEYHGCAAINWHIESFSRDYNWDIAYDRILAWIAENGGLAGSIKDAIKYLKLPFYDTKTETIF